MTNVVQRIGLCPSGDIPFNKSALTQSNTRQVKAGLSIDQRADKAGWLILANVLEPFPLSRMFDRIVA
jgi:hypothetical protein